ncbi:MAG: hypothetical protein AAFQ90_13735 [Pseudomonadota bacterium]
MRLLNNSELGVVSGGSRTGPNPSTDDGSDIASITATLQAAFDNATREDPFTREDFVKLLPADPSDWPALEALYDSVLAELGGVD